MKIRIGSRGSALALAQTNAVARALRAREHEVEVVVIQTAGDRDQDAKFADIGAPGVFVREIEAALLAGDVDLAVHSFKDLPSRGPEGLVVAAIPERLDAADHLIARPELVLAEAAGGREASAAAAQAAGGPRLEQAGGPRQQHAGSPRPEHTGGPRQEHAFATGVSTDGDAALLPLVPGAVVGTASERRRALLRALRPDLKLEAIRGNVPTRLDKLRRGPCQAIVLAGAGLERLARDPDAPPLGLEELVDLRLDPRVFVPSPAQGAIALQCRADDPVVEAVAPLHDETAALPVRAERELLRLVDGGCSLPFGAWARLADGDRLELYAVLEAGGVLVRAQQHAVAPEELAARVWQELEAASGDVIDTSEARFAPGASPREEARET